MKINMHTQSTDTKAFTKALLIMKKCEEIKEEIKKEAQNNSEIMFLNSVGNFFRHLSGLAELYPGARTSFIESAIHQLERVFIESAIHDSNLKSIDRAQASEGYQMQHALKLEIL